MPLLFPRDCGFGSGDCLFDSVRIPKAWFFQQLDAQMAYTVYSLGCKQMGYSWIVIKIVFIIILIFLKRILIQKFLNMNMNNFECEYGNIYYQR
jgi:hypothetical protein